MFSADLGGYTAPPPAATDPPFQKVALLLHGDGTNGAQNNTFVDSSTNNFTITRTGNVAQGTFSPFSLPEGQWSNYFDGSGDYLTVPSNTNLQLGLDDFCIEMFYYMGAVNNNARMIQYGTGTGAGEYMIYTSYPAPAYVNIHKEGLVVTSNTVVNLNEWTHIVVCRQSGVLSMFQNGVRTANAGFNTNISASVVTNIGVNITGSISNLRITKGSSPYSVSATTITPPTAPLTAITNTSLLTCQSNRFKDNSSNNFTITRNGDTKVTAFSPFAPSAAYSASTNGGSAYFDGSGDSLNAPANAGFSFGTGDFCLECFHYPTITSGHNTFFNNAFVAGWVFRNSNLTPNLYANSNTAITSSSDCVLNSWNHIVLCRVGTTMSIFLNGVRTASVTYSSNINGASQLNIGTDTQYYLTGYLSNNRVIKGSSPYDPTQTTCTVPTAPLTAVANTQLLLNCTNAGIIDNAGKNNIETVGNAQISTSVKKYGTGSMYFDGSGDYLLNQGNIDSFTFGTGDFTIEGWFSFSSLVSGGTFVDFRPFGGNGVYPAISYNSTYGITYFVNGSNVINSNLTPTVGTWYHIAISRSGSSTKMFINGVQYGSTWTDTTNYIVGGRGPVIGVNAFNTSLAFNGYIDDLRITKGQALYTANFTPPTQAFPNV